MSEITLSAGVRSNLLSLQNTADLMSKTQNRLATGKKVNSALDNPTNFFTSSSLQTRSNDLSSLLDSMSNGIKTLEAADNGLSAMTKTLETMQATLRQARQDKTFQTQSFGLNVGDTPAGTEQVSFSGGALAAAQTVDLTNAQGVVTGAAYANLDFSNGANDDGVLNFDISINGGAAVSITIDAGDGDLAGANDLSDVTGAELADAINAKLTAAEVDAVASFAGGAIVFTAGADSATDSGDASVTISDLGVQNGVTQADFGFDAGGTASVTEVTEKSVDALVQEINNNTDLNTAIRASNDNGQLRIENLSTQTLTVGGLSADGQITGGGEESEIGGNQIRTNLSRQFNELRDQLDKLAEDASYNGINLLRGDNLRMTFNETGTSTLDIQVEGGNAINSAYLNVFNVEASDFDSDANIDSLLGDIKTGMDTIRSQASEFGANLSVVENRTNFTKNMMNTLQTGADNLVLADTNEEGANMLALQTRQQLSSVALSLASQSDQAVLRLF
jgi:flagellin